MAGPSSQSTLLGFLRDRYLSVDPRILGLFRVYFGLFLTVDVLRRLPDAGLFYSNDGVLSNHFNLFAPQATPAFSLLNAFSTRPEVYAAFVFMAACHFGLALGYRTKLFQVLSLVSVVSLNARNLFLENGGGVMSAVLSAWTVFLPLGARYSIDSMQARLRARDDQTADSLNHRDGMGPRVEKVVSLAVLAIAIEIAVCYFFNTVHKHGSTWSRGEAVHWVLWQNRIATYWAGLLRMHEPSWLSPALSYGTLVIEGVAPILVLSPFFQSRLRALHVFMVWTLHVSIALLVSVGPFSYAMIGLNLLVLPGDVLDRVAAFFAKRGAGERVLVYRAREPALHAFARVLARLDAFGRLRFVDADDRPRCPADAPEARLALRTPEGTWVEGRAAALAALAALPLGALLSPLASAPPLAWLVDSSIRERNAGDDLGLPSLKGARLPEDAEPGFVAVRLPVPILTRFAAVGQAAAALLLVAVVIQISHDNWWLPPKARLEQPKALAPIVLYPRLLQGWSMFAPDAPLTDGTLVVDGVTADGRHLDPFTLHAPDFDAALHGPWYIGQLRCDYWLKIHFDGNAGYRDELRRYLERWHEIERRPPEDRLVSFTVYWVENDAPPPGSTTPRNIRKNAILTHAVVGRVANTN